MTSKRKGLSSSFLVQAGLTTGLIAVGLVGMFILFSLRGTPKKGSDETIVQHVSVVPLRHYEQAPVTIRAYGTVQPAHKVELRPEVSGVVTRTIDDLRPGTIVAANTVLAEIDSHDYEQALVRAQSNVLSAEASLELELGQQVVAREEFQLLDKNMSSKSNVRALRKPQLKDKQAALASARSQLAQAQRNLERTKITTPFPALILSENLELGQYLTNQSVAATLIDTREFFVETELELDKLAFVTPNAQVRVECTQGIFEGRVIGPVGDLDTNSRLATVLISIPDPIQPSQRLFIGDYLTVDIVGIPAQDVYEIPRAAVRSRNTVWVVNNDNRLAVKQFSSVFSNPDNLLVRGDFIEGDALIVSSIPVMKPGMPVSRITLK
jgi:RND family efflux transporter MFP subunit